MEFLTLWKCPLNQQTGSISYLNTKQPLNKYKYSFHPRKKSWRLIKIGRRSCSEQHNILSYFVTFEKIDYFCFWKLLLLFCQCAGIFFNEMGPHRFFIDLLINTHNTIYNICYYYILSQYLLYLYSFIILIPPKLKLAEIAHHNTAYK